MKGELVLLSDAEARAELDKLGAAFGDDAIAGLDALGLLPRARHAVREGVPCVALTLVVNTTGATSADTIDRARSSLAPLVEFFELASESARDRLVRVLDEWLGKRAVLGDLAAMLPLLGPQSLESLRGPARAEWRVRQARAALQRLGVLEPPTINLPADSMTGPRRRLSTVPSLPSVPAPVAEQDDLAARWLDASPDTRGEIAAKVLRGGTLAEHVEAFELGAPGEVVPLLVAVAEAAHGGPDGVATALDALTMAWSRAEGDERTAIGRRRVRIAREHGVVRAEVDAIEDALPELDSLERTTALKRLASLFEDALERPEQAATRLVEAISAGTFDDEMVQHASRLLESARQWSVLLGVLRTAARAARRPERKGQLYRRIATLALHHLDDVDEAIALVREGMDATGGDPRLASQLVDLAAAASDREAERAGLEVLVADGAERPEARRVDRLIAVLLDLGDSDAAVDLVERLLALPERDGALDTVLDRRLPEVSEASGDVLARTRWLRRRAERETAPLEALRLWQQVVANEELLGVDPAERVATIERALDAAAEGGVAAGDIAELYLAAAAQQLELGRVAVAGSHLARIGRGALRVSGAHERIGSLIDALDVADEDDDVALDAMHGIVLATRDPDLLVEWARVAADSARWAAATEALELAIDRLAGDEQRSASVIRDLARMYEHMNAPDDP